MENQKHKKKKIFSHKVTISEAKLSQDTHQVLMTNYAYFPYQPYPEQVTLISKLHHSILNKHNVLVQSPTGTGKTLCMLVGSLSALCSLTLTPDVKVPKIYYLTRTHSQITQVINELKRLPWYNCKINIIASREHFCINRNLKDLKGKNLDRGCQQMCKQKLCRYKQQTSQNNLPFKQWLTIQQLCEKGSKKTFCPFYSSKMSTQKCQLTIMPFNYLLDWGLFDHNNFNLKNSVIIFDQAHNIDSLAQQGSSLQIDTDILTQALIQVKNLQQSSKCRYLHKKFENQYDNSDFAYISQTKSLLMRMNSVLRQSSQERNFNETEQMLRQIKKMTNFVCNDQQFKGVDLNNYEDVIFSLDKVRKLFNQKKIECSQFQQFFNVFNKIMNILDKNTNNMEDYFMFIGPKSSKNYSIKFNCLNASFTFQRILQQKPRSIVLCSGTLGAFQIWQNQLGFQFQSKIRLPSFIKSNQIYGKIVGYSLNNQVRYEFSYQNRNRQEQFQALGQQLRQIQKNIPNGIVVAFSTYQLMQRCLKYCLGLQKKVFYQSKNENIQKIYLKYSQAAKQQKGAILFIVMKGKFSQGINFNDELCRCLIVIGIPFLPPNDNKVVRKKRYLTNKFSKQVAEQWYYSQTFKCVNQVIGRVIRSKKDYGCVLLIDQRYSRKDILKQLPSWFVNNLQLQIDNKYISKVKQFFFSKKQMKDQKKQPQQSSLQIVLSKTILASQENKLLLQALLDQQTPVKVKKGKIKNQKPGRLNQKKDKPKIKHISLNIDSNEQSLQNLKQTFISKQIKVLDKDKDKDQSEKIRQSNLKTYKMNSNDYPWLSIDYFVNNQIEQFIKQSKTTAQTSRKLSNNSLKEDHRLDNIDINEQDVKTSLTVHLNNLKRKNIKYI